MLSAESFFSNERIAELLEKYLGKNFNLSDIFRKSSEDLTASKCYIPILGTQGSGKSSFLNALLFNDIVLPVDADETTCIPTAVSYSSSSSPDAFVLFKNGTRKAIKCTESSLAEYVHQAKNPGNQKDVAQIEIHVQHPLLEKGIVLVDLPGVGSITKGNQQVTLDYLKKSTAAIFMLRTVPPITRSESCFIQGALPLMGYVFWVQNQWTDETNDEVKDGRSHNYYILQDIAKRIHYPSEQIREPFVVCVKKALDGGILNNSAMTAASKIQDFRNELGNFADQWKLELQKKKALQAKELTQYALNNIQALIQRLSGDVSVELEKLNKAKKEAEEALENNKRISDNAISYLREQKKQISEILVAECQKAAENLRNSVREVIDNGVVGGERLNKAFADYLQNENAELFQRIQPVFLDTARTLQKQLEGMKACGYDEMPEGDIKINFSDKSKAPDFYGRIGGSVGGIGGGFAAGAALGSVVPGVGTVIGGCVGALLGGLGGWFVGSMLRKVHLGHQKKTAKQELFDYIESYREKIQENYKKSFQNFIREVDQAVYEWLQKQDCIINDGYKTAKEELEKPVSEKEELLGTVKKEFEELSHWNQEME